MRWLANHDCLRSHFPRNLRCAYENPSHCESEDSQSYRILTVYVPQIMLIIASRMVTLISFQHMLFWCMFLDSHSIVHHSSEGVHLRSNNKLVTFTLKGKIVLVSTQPHTSVSKVDVCNSNIATPWGECSPLGRVVYHVQPRGIFVGDILMAWTNYMDHFIT